MGSPINLKPLSRDAIPSALSKAERYRLLNEPGAAESICLDVLDIDPDNQTALVTMLLALTDQFPQEASSRALRRAGELTSRLTSEYDRAYYAGIIRERRAKAVLERGRFGASATATEWLREAMDCYERAEALRPPQNDDAVLRWNACARLLMDLPETAGEAERPAPLQLE